LWKKAFDKLSDDDKNSLPFTDDDSDGHNYLEHVLDKTVESRNICREKGLKFKFGEKMFVVRDLADKILSWVEKFKQIGDIAMQYDPGHATLPWAGIRLLLQVCPSLIGRQVDSADVSLAGVDRQREYEGSYFRGREDHKIAVAMQSIRKILHAARSKAFQSHQSCRYPNTTIRSCASISSK
jgi:hypothetical protein